MLNVLGLPSLRKFLFSLPPLSTTQGNKSLFWSHSNSYFNKLSPSFCLSQSLIDLLLSRLSYSTPLPSPQPTISRCICLSKSVLPFCSSTIFYQHNPGKHSQDSINFLELPSSWAVTSRNGSPRKKVPTLH